MSASDLFCTAQILRWTKKVGDIPGKWRNESPDMRHSASPAGWHVIPSEYKGGKDSLYLDTRGNNVLAQDNPDGGNSMNGYRPSGGSDLTFDFKLGWPKAGHVLDPASASTG